jgi:hypothetical protein
LRLRSESRISRKLLVQLLVRGVRLTGVALEAGILTDVMLMARDCGAPRALVVMQLFRLKRFRLLIVRFQPPLMTAAGTFHRPSPFRYRLVQSIPGRAGGAFNDVRHRISF